MEGGGVRMGRGRERGVTSLREFCAVKKDHLSQWQKKCIRHFTKTGTMLLLTGHP